MNSEADGKIKHGATTDIGLARETNEDVYLTEPPLFAVADGMGGHTAGDVAARTAIEVLSREVRQNHALDEAVKSANEEVFQMASSNPDQKGMGTTLTAMVADDNSAQFVHVGDSRAYLLRQAELSRITNDHTVVERLVREGRIRPEDADRHPQRSVLERALGVEAQVQTDSHTLILLPGDRVLLCSDGLTSQLTDSEIRGILEEEADPVSASRQLVAEAVRSGGADNITAVVVDFPGEPAPRSSRGSDSVRAAISGSQTITGPARKRTFRVPRKLILGAIALLLALASLALARTAALRSFYVGIDGGRVAVFRGIPGSFAGVEIRELEERTDLDASSLPEVYQTRLEEGIRASGRDDASSIVADLKDLQAGAGQDQTAPGAVP